MAARKPLSREDRRLRREEVARKAAAGELRFPDAIREMRQALGLTQASFAGRFGLTRLQVIALEAGKANPTLETLQKIAMPFGFQVGFVPRRREEVSGGAGG